VGTIRILLVGEGLDQHSQVAQCLACWGAERHYASSVRQACALLKEQAFDLIISRLKLTDGSALQMAPLLEGSPATLFCSQPVAIGCWWLPVVESGKLCWGMPGLRAKEFGELLHQMVTARLSLLIIEETLERGTPTPCSPIRRSKRVRAGARSDRMIAPS